MTADGQNLAFHNPKFGKPVYFFISDNPIIEIIFRIFQDQQIIKNSRMGPKFYKTLITTLYEACVMLNQLQSTIFCLAYVLDYTRCAS